VSRESASGSGFKVQGAGSVQHPEPGTLHSEPGSLRPEPGTLNPEPEKSESDTPMTSTYIQVLVLETLIWLALWIFGRAFA
jgi:hypothetical protein